MEQAYSFMDVIFLLVGLYILYCGYELKFKGKIKEGVLVPKDANVKKCGDKAAYTKEIFPKTMIYGALVTIWGIFSLLNDRYGFVQNGYLIFIGLFLLITIWFALATKSAYEKYWPLELTKKTKKK